MPYALYVLYSMCFMPHALYIRIRGLSHDGGIFISLTIDIGADTELRAHIKAV